MILNLAYIQNLIAYPDTFLFSPITKMIILQPVHKKTGSHYTQSNFIIKYWHSINILHNIVQVL